MPSIWTNLKFCHVVKLNRQEKKKKMSLVQIEEFADGNFIVAQMVLNILYGVGKILGK